MEIFVTFDPSVVRIVIIFTLYVSHMKLENFAYKDVEEDENSSEEKK